MRPVRTAALTSFYFFVFIIQEAIISRIHFPISGFSLYLAVVISMLLLEAASNSLILGFIAGVILDLSPSSNGPFGQWALILTVVAYLISANSDIFEEAASRPLGLGLFVSLGSGVALAAYLLVGILLGESNGSFNQDFIVIFGNCLYTAMFVPLFSPVLEMIRESTMSLRER